MDHAKNATLVTLGAKDADGCRISFEAVPIEPLHDMRRIKGPLDELIGADVVDAADAEDYLHVTLTDGQPIIDALARLRAVYPNVMSLEYERTRPDDGAADTAPDIAVERLDPTDLFARFYEERTGAELTEEQERIAFKALRAQMERGSQDEGEMATPIAAPSPAESEGGIR